MSKQRDVTLGVRARSKSGCTSSKNDVDAVRRVKEKSAGEKDVHVEKQRPTPSAVSSTTMSTGTTTVAEDVMKFQGMVLGLKGFTAGFGRVGAAGL